MLPFHPVHDHAPVRHCRYDRWYRRHRGPCDHLLSLSARKNAEDQVRYRFWQLSHLVRIPKLYGVSAVGRQLSFYTYDRASRTVEPGPLAPIERWNTNIMEEVGRAKFLAVVEEIKQMVAIIEAVEVVEVEIEVP